MLFYLIGIKGSGMSALAKILLDYGYEVRGCDYGEHFFTEDGLNVEIDFFDNLQLSKDYYYIIGNAFENHSVVKKIIDMNYQYDYYAHFISSFFSKKLVCVAGTHGKTTTTSLISALNPGVNYLIGDGSGYGNKNSKWFVVESCEYKDTFLNYRPEILLILNVEFDHPDYFKDLNAVKESFSKFINQAKLVVINGDDPNTKDLSSNSIRYGMNEDNDIVFKYSNNTIYICDEEYQLSVPGIHYAYDFVGAYIVSKLMNRKSIEIENNLLKWKLPRRRRELVVKRKQIVVCDYAHHPTEITALYNSLNEEFKNYKKIIIYEPHTYSRTISLIDEYRKSLNEFDYCYLYDIFISAREKYNYDLEKIIYRALIYERFKEYLFLRFKEMDNIVLCFVGAGKIDKLYNNYLKILEE